jgi:DNA-binding CsgD family transcriptional regulator
LTRREREVVTLIALGGETAEIARELHISPETVRTHVRNARSKLGARTRAQLVAVFICNEHAVEVPSLDDWSAVPSLARRADCRGSTDRGSTAHPT